MFNTTRNQLESFFRVNAKVEPKTDIEKNGPSPMERLPPELKESLAFFLSTRDLLSLAETSKSISSDLNLSIASSPLTDRVSQDKKFRSWGLKCFAVVIPKEVDLSPSKKTTCEVQTRGIVAPDLPVSHPNPHLIKKSARQKKDKSSAIPIQASADDTTRAHSMTFTCKVQEHGFAQARVSIVEQHLPGPTSWRPNSREPEYLRSGAGGFSRLRGKTVAQSSARLESNACLSFPVKPGKFYQLYVSTGGSEEEDDFVQFSDMRLHRIGFDEKSTEYTGYQFDVWEHPFRSSFQANIHVFGGMSK